MDRAQRVLSGEATLDETDPDLEEARARLTAATAAWAALDPDSIQRPAWRTWLCRYPLSFALGAFGLGALLGWRDRQ